MKIHKQSESQVTQRIYVYKTNPILKTVTSTKAHNLIWLVSLQSFFVSD